MTACFNGCCARSHAHPQVNVPGLPTAPPALTSKATLANAGRAASEVLSERRWHPSQEIVKADGSRDAIELQLCLAGLEEVTRWVLSLFMLQLEADLNARF